MVAASISQAHAGSYLCNFLYYHSLSWAMSRDEAAPVLFVHIPRVLASPEKHEEWIMLAVSSALTGSALLIRKYST